MERPDEDSFSWTGCQNREAGMVGHRDIIHGDAFVEEPLCLWLIRSTSKGNGDKLVLVDILEYFVGQFRGSA
jgi:hypothetical protein